MSVFDPIETHIEEVHNTLPITHEWLESNGFINRYPEFSMRTYLRDFNHPNISYIELKDVGTKDLWIIDEAVMCNGWYAPSKKTSLIKTVGELKTILKKYSYECI